jgi:hypothetical protein
MTPRGFARALGWAFFGALGLFFLACAGMALPGDLALALGFGWIWFLGRVGPEMTISWVGVATAAVAAGLCLALGHVLLRRLSESSINTEGQVRWPFARTAALFAGAVLMFVAGIAAVGVAHQAAWIIRSGDPIVSDGSRVAMRMQSSNNLKHLALAAHAYEDKDELRPPSASFDPAGRGLHGWLTFLLPGLEQQTLFNEIQLERPWTDPANQKPMSAEVVGFLAHRHRPKSRDGYGLGYYALNAHVAATDQVRRSRDVSDGTSNTILAGEVIENPAAWGSTTNWRDPALGINRSPAGFGSTNRDSALFSLMDGSVRPISANIDPRVLRALSTPNGGEEINDDPLPNAKR